jgi:ABC-2 type transport system permease protein
VLIGVRAEQFDDVAFAQTFVPQPLIFLGGVFYSAEVSIPLSLAALTAATGALFFFNLRLFQPGYKLRS